MVQTSKKQNSPSSKKNAKSSRNVRTGLGLEAIRHSLAENLFYIIGKPPSTATLNDCYMAVAYSVRDRMLRYCVDSAEQFFKRKEKAVCYFSAEFLTGPHLGNNLINLGIYATMQKAVQEYGLDLNQLIDQEVEPGLGNGGLGRLAACYLDSMATLGIPAIGYGIRYEFGIFDQKIYDGWQAEMTDSWLRLGNPWEIPRPERVYDVKFGGYTETYTDANGHYRVRWIPDRIVKGMAYDTPILGYKVKTAGMLRLWKAEAPQSFNFEVFNTGDYYKAVEEKLIAENISKVLYPNDEPLQGKQLRLEQQMFFVSCSLQNMIENHLIKEDSLNNFHETFVAQLNDTHPSIAVAELMRLFVDDHKMEWNMAWDIVQKTFCYTNHTLLPEALEKWPVPLFKSLLPRHLEIIYEINHRFLSAIELKYPNEPELLSNLSILDESHDKYVRMANLACIGSRAINGVAELHTELLQKHTLKDFYRVSPKKFSNKTNGVTPRRWLILSNPHLTELISDKIGDKWIQDFTKLKKLESHVDDIDFITEWRQIKQQIKQEQTEFVFLKTGTILNADSIFDVQVKRIHEYKRQHLNVLHIITLYNRLKKNPKLKIPPRAFVFGGKAAPGYYMAKLIIKLINSVAEVINNDPDINDMIKVIFIRNFNVKTGHRIYPMADLSEQISTAGKEASGTGNMKFSMNGALTIGTLDGANIEIRQEVGPENFFLFGLNAQEVDNLKANKYNPLEYYSQNLELRSAIHLIESGLFSPGDKDLYKPLIDTLLFHDEYMLMADYASYIECQEKVNKVWEDQTAWTKMSILNVARMGKFSSDRAIREYCKDIWKIKI